MKHVSPNNAEPGSFVYAAEAWLLSKGLNKLPSESRQPHMFQGMLDDFADSDAYPHWDQPQTQR